MPRICSVALSLAVVGCFAVQIPDAESMGHGHWNLGFRFDDHRPIFLHSSLHFLLASDGNGSAFFCLGTGDAGIGFGLVGLQAMRNVLTDIDVGNID